jgi:hypothetical protein
MVCVTARFAHAQNSQFFFDPTGNLQAQAAETSELPQIIGQPQMQVVIPGNNASFSVSVADTPGVSYQWFFNSSAIPGATSDSLFLTNVSTANQGPYFVSVSNTFGSVASVLANLYIDSRGCGMPDSWQLQYFGNLNQNALGDYDGDGVPNLQEFLDGTNPTNAASALYRITLLNYGGGSVVAVPDQPAYSNGQVVTLTATGSDTAPFHAWTGDVVTRSNSITLTMTTNKTLYAFFEPFEFQWTNSASGDWEVAANWTPNLAPGSNEIVVIPGEVTVTLNSNVDLLNLTLSSPFASVGPELTGSGRLTISGIGTWWGGTMSGTGATVVLLGASFTIPETALSLALANRTFENGGMVYWNGGYFSVDGGVITNDAEAQFEMQGPASFDFGGGAPRFDNAGTFLTASNGTTAFEGVAFNNYGLVNILGGTFTMAGGGVQAGTITVPAGTTINFGGGTFTSTGSSSITGAGTLIVNGGTSVTLSGLVNLGGTNTFSNGATELNGNYICTNNTMVISGGNVDFDGTGTVSPSVINLSNGSLGGSNLVTVGSAMSWTGGSMIGTGRTIIPPGVTLTISNSIGLASRTLDNGGTMTWSGGNLNMNGGVITNEPGAIFQVQSPGYIGFAGGSPRWDNAGTFIMTGNGTMAFAEVAFNNFNRVGIQGGTLYFEGGGNNTGSISVPDGTAINFAGGTFNSSGGSSITGGGNLLVSGGTETLSGVVNLSGSNIFSAGGTELNGAYTCTNNALSISGGTVNFDGASLVSPSVISLSSGTLGGSNLVTASSAMSWTGGAMSGTGRMFIPPGVTLTISNSTPISITSRTLDSAGTVTWTGAGAINMNGGVITNRVGALFNSQNASLIEFAGGTPRFDNAGTFRKTASAGTLTFASLSFANYGTVDIQRGVLYADGGGYASSSNAVLNCALAGTTPGTNYGQLQVSGAVTLNGTVSVNLTNNYIPTTNDSFTVLSAGTRNGTFTTFSYPSNQVTMQLSNTASSVIVRVTGVAVPPPAPLLLPPTLSGTNVLLTWTAVSNTTYRVQFNPDLTPSNWNALLGDVLGLSNTASKQDTLTSSNRFYRVQVLP